MLVYVMDNPMGVNLKTDVLVVCQTTYPTIRPLSVRKGETEARL